LAGASHCGLGLELTRRGSALVQGSLAELSAAVSLVARTQGSERFTEPRELVAVTSCQCLGAANQGCGDGIAAGVCAGRGEDLVEARDA